MDLTILQYYNVLAILKCRQNLEGIWRPADTWNGFNIVQEFMNGNIYIVRYIYLQTGYAKTPWNSLLWCSKHSPLCFVYYSWVIITPVLHYMFILFLGIL